MVDAHAKNVSQKLFSGDILHLKQESPFVEILNSPRKSLTRRKLMLYIFVDKERKKDETNQSETKEVLSLRFFKCGKLY